jgi:hypothetical protein
VAQCGSRVVVDEETGGEEMGGDLVGQRLAERAQFDADGRVEFDIGDLVGQRGT